MGNIRELVTEIDKNKKQTTRFFQIGINQEDNRKIQLRTFEEAENEVLQILNIHHKPKSNRESKTVWEKEIKKAAKRGVIFKAIYPKKIILPKVIQELNKKYPKKFQVKRYNAEFIRWNIINGKKVLIKLVNEDPIMFGGVFLLKTRNSQIT